VKFPSLQLDWVIKFDLIIYPTQDFDMVAIEIVPYNEEQLLDRPNVMAYLTFLTVIRIAQDYGGALETYKIFERLWLDIQAFLLGYIQTKDSYDSI